MGVLRNLQILLPSIDQQKQIVCILDDYWNNTQFLKNNIEKQIETLKALKTRLISDVVTGKIDVRDIEIPEYEFVAEEQSETSPAIEEAEEQED